MTDSLPENICSICVNLFEKFILFHDTCKQSDQTLHQIVLDEDDEDDLPISFYTKNVTIKSEFLLKDEPEESKEDISISNDENFVAQESEVSADDDDDVESIKSETKLNDEDEKPKELETILKNIKKNGKEQVKCPMCTKIMRENTLAGHVKRHLQG